MYRYDYGKHNRRAEGWKVNFLDSDWKRTCSKALGSPRLTCHCLASEDANWAEQSMSFVFSCQHFSERLLPNTRREALLRRLHFLVAIIITVFSWKKRINYSFEKNSHCSEVFKHEAKHKLKKKKLVGGYSTGIREKEKPISKQAGWGDFFFFFFCHYIPLCLFYPKGGFSHSFCLFPGIESCFLGCLLNDLCNWFHLLRPNW